MMNSILHALIASLCVAQLMATPAYAIDGAKPSHDLVFGLNDDASTPFYQTASFMLGDKTIKVEPGALPNKELVSYDATAGKIIVTDDKTVAEADKGAAVLQLMDSLSVSTIEPAAGR